MGYAEPVRLRVEPVLVAALRLREGWMRCQGRTRSVILEGANTRPAAVYVKWGVPNVVGAPPQGAKCERKARVSDVALEGQCDDDLEGPGPGQSEPAFGSWSPQTATKSEMADRDLLDRFCRVRSQTRGPLAAVNERTMITNLGASELLQPADRRLLSEHATKLLGFADDPTTLVLCSGVEVTITAQLVGGQHSPKGAVLHLSVEVPARESPTLAPVKVVERDASPGTSRSLDPALMTGWTDLADTERTVAELVARGLTNKQAGRMMFLSRHTVDYHLRRVFRKLGVSSRVELARLLGEHYEALTGC